MYLSIIAHTKVFLSAYSRLNPVIAYQTKLLGMQR
jgi:hypothetical protein